MHSYKKNKNKINNPHMELLHIKSVNLSKLHYLFTLFPVKSKLIMNIWGRCLAELNIYISRNSILIEETGGEER